MMQPIEKMVQPIEKMVQPIEKMVQPIERMKLLIDRLEMKRVLSKEEFIFLIGGRTPELGDYLFEKARRIRRKYYGTDVYLRGLIEFTNCCKNDCYYCGIRRSNRNVTRYRLTKEQILFCCGEGYGLGLRTFVLQGGEDGRDTDETLVDIVRAVKARFPDCALTLSVGERSCESYEALYNAGADRYLLRHETADPDHYARLHPPSLTLEARKKCLADLKKIGYQVGCGFMVGSPGQTPGQLAEDLLFLYEFQPQMVGIGPFIPHHDTPFASEQSGTAELTLFLLGLIRLILPAALLPATTALATVDPSGWEKGILAGANVIMPNLSPRGARENYQLYDQKICAGDEAAECLRSLQERISGLGYRVSAGRGDHIFFKEEVRKQGGNKDV